MNLRYYFEIQQVQFSFYCIVHVCTLGHKFLPLRVVIAVCKSWMIVNFSPYYENMSVLFSDDLCLFGINFQIGLERMRMRRI
jgi:hypothetical protein